MFSPGSKTSAEIHPSAPQKILAITLAAEAMHLLSFKSCHFKLCHFLLQVRYGVINFIARKNTKYKIIFFTSMSLKRMGSDCCCCCRCLRRLLFYIALHHLLSTSEEPNEQKWFSSLSFQTSPELHGALLQASLQCHPH